MFRISISALIWGFVAVMLSSLLSFIFTFGLATAMGLLGEGISLGQSLTQFSSIGQKSSSVLMIWGTVTFVLAFLLQTIPGMVVAKRAPAGFEYLNVAVLAFLVLLVLGRLPGTRISEIAGFLIALTYFSAAFLLGAYLYLRRWPKPGVAATTP